uniref:Uncharacterized protein n=1 Tax=Anguilla anguilla TaxID=7936 RepID=A0A0E9QF05_ANGAN
MINRAKSSNINSANRWFAIQLMTVATRSQMFSKFKKFQSISIQLLLRYEIITTVYHDLKRLYIIVLH